MSIIKVHQRTFEPFISAKLIEDRVSEIAIALNKDYEGKHPVFIAVLNGAFIFAADLLRKVSFPHEITFVKLSSYEGTQTTGKVKQLIGLKEDLANRHVIILEDIVETGTTLKALIESLQIQKPESIKVATLLTKKVEGYPMPSIDYVGFDIPNRFVLGYGLDYDGYGRNLDQIYAERS